MENGYQLPEDLIEEILLRMKVKSLLRFKCVCKKWYALIENKFFIRNHFNYQSNHLLAHHYNDDKDDYAITFYMDETLLRYEEPLHFQLQSFYLNAVPCCYFDGIFCIINDDKELSLWNPANREFRSLPISRPDIPPHFTFYYRAIGFGFEPFKSDYKVVFIQDFLHYDDQTTVYDHYPAQVVSVYTFSLDSWRHFEDKDVLPNHTVINPICNTYLNGFLYWPASMNDYSAVVSFDLCKEVLKVIQIPDNIRSNQLRIYNNSIALISFGGQVSEGCVDIWLMNESESWTKHITIGPSINLRWDTVHLWNNKLFCAIESFQTISYDLDTQEIIILFEDHNHCAFFDYKESLISVKRKN